MVKVIAALVAFVGILAIIIAGTLLNGWIVYVMWGWFVVPLGIVKIGVWHACGLSAFAQLFINNKAKDLVVKERGKNATLVITPFVILLFGYIMHLFM